VPDPHPGGAEGFETKLDLVESAADGLIAAMASNRRFRSANTALNRVGFASAPPGVSGSKRMLCRTAACRRSNLDKIARLLA
jgi:hypothetical protein